MSAQTSRFPNRRHFGEKRRGRCQEDYVDDNTLVEENKRLKHQLNMETAKFLDADSKVIQLSKDLKETRLQLEKQKKLKEMYINQGKDTKKEIETMQKYADAETLSTAKIAFQAQNAMKHKKKKLLQKDYEELQVAHLVSQQKFSTELQMKEDKNKALQEELDAAQISYQELQLKYDADVLEMKQQTETLQREMKSHMDKAAQDQQLINKLRAELDTLRQQMEQEIVILQQKSKEAEMCLQVQLKQSEDSFKDLTCKYEADVLSARNETEALQEELNNQSKAHKETETKDQLLINKLRAELDALCEQMEQERAAWQQRSEESERRLQVELEKIKTSYKELSFKYEASVLTAREEPETLQHELKIEVKAHEETRMKNQLLINNPRAELDGLHQELQKKRAAREQVSEDKDKHLQVDLQQTQDSDQGLCCTYDPYVHAAKKEEKTLQQELQEMKAAFATFEDLSKQFPEELLDEFIHEVSPDVTELARLCKEPLPEEIHQPHPDPGLEMPEQALPETKKKTPSAFKRFRHFLGLRKPQKWKKKPPAS